MTIVNVKPAALLTDPEVASSLRWPHQLFRDRGWQYEIWSGGDPVYLANVRFLASQRRSGLVTDELLDLAAMTIRSGDTIAALLQRMADSSRSWLEVKAAVIRLLWQHRCVTDLHRPLDLDSRLEVTS